ncbi:hypothetical protein LTR17_021926 [Elasticomyces elasticus]|nr:hypothetical protein LTR17_021926 [Elasticomyces elasticus]
MPEVTTRLAWAVRVNPADLVASIEIEAAFRPVADTLRLCNVFGKGEFADITRLPKELVDHIEEYLIADKAAAKDERRAHHQSLAECCAGHCSPWEKHMTEEVRLALVNDVLHQLGRPAVDSLDETGAQAAVDIMRNQILWHQEDYVKAAHVSTQDEWQKLVGKAGAESHDQGVITKTRDFMLKHFGLVIFVAHRGRGHGNAHDTFAYLTLPEDPKTNATTHSYEVRVGDSKKDTPCEFYDYSSPEESSAHEVNNFPILTKSEGDRFLKLLVSLRMPGWKWTTSEFENQKLRTRALPKPMILARVIRMDMGEVELSTSASSKRIV